MEPGIARDSRVAETDREPIFRTPASASVVLILVIFQIGYHVAQTGLQLDM